MSICTFIIILIGPNTITIIIILGTSTIIIILGSSPFTITIILGASILVIRVGGVCGEEDNARRVAWAANYSVSPEPGKENYRKGTRIKYLYL